MSKLLPHEREYIKKRLITHKPDKCEGRECCIHNPSDHHMRKWKMNFRFDKGVMERICPEHGVGHPDPDDAAYWIRLGKSEMTVHGCCGCCDQHTPTIRHNGVGEGDMYSDNEYAQLMIPQSIQMHEVSDIHFLCVAAVLEPGQWVDWEVAFTYRGDACLGFLQACPAHPHLMHHHQIENCCYE